MAEADQEGVVWREPWRREQWEGLEWLRGVRTGIQTAWKVRKGWMPKVGLEAVGGVHSGGGTDCGAMAASMDVGGAARPQGAWGEHSHST